MAINVETSNREGIVAADKKERNDFHQFDAKKGSQLIKKISRWLAPAVVIATGIILPAQAAAFDYSEHNDATGKAIEEVNRVHPFSESLKRDMDAAVKGTPIVNPVVLNNFDNLQEGRGYLPDMGALAGDHSKTPHDLWLRWFWSEPSSKSCKFTNLTGSARDMDVRPSERPDIYREHEENAPTNINLLFQTVRFHDIHGWHNNFTSDAAKMDVRLAAADCLYFWYAQRGSYHFRRPGVDIEEDLTNSKDPNVFFAYGKWHTLALQIAARSYTHSYTGSHDRAVAMFFELYALHYLQDAVAAGHMVTSRKFGVPTILKTHAYYNKIGIAVNIPKEVCTYDLKNYPKLNGYCHSTHPVEMRVTGDSSLSDGTANQPNNVTGEIAKLVSVISLNKVVDVIEGRDSNVPETKFANEIDGISPAFMSRAANCTADFACPEQTSHLKEIIKTMPEDYFKALTILPSPVDPFPPTIETPGGYYTSVYLSSSFDRHETTEILGIGRAFLADVGTPFEISGAGVFAMAKEPMLGIHGAVTINWAQWGKWSFANELGLTLLASPKTFQVKADVIPLSRNLIYKDLYTLDFGVLAGISKTKEFSTTTSSLDPFVGLVLKGNFHAKRDVSPQATAE